MISTNTYIPPWRTPSFSLLTLYKSYLTVKCSFLTFYMEDDEDRIIIIIVWSQRVNSTV